MAKFDREICSENLVPQSLQILYIIIRITRKSFNNLFVESWVFRIYIRNTSPPPQKSRLIYYSQGY